MSTTAGTGWLRRNWDIVVLLALAGLVYRPWDVPHLPLTDFGMVFGARGNSGSFLTQLGGVTSYYLSEGRFCLLTHLYLVIGGAAFGTWAPGWHWTYFALNTATLLLARGLLFKIGIGRVAALVALALWATMGPTAELWLRPAGEQLGLIFFLTAMHYAVNFNGATDWRRRTLVIAACAVALVYTKEILVVMLPAVWITSRLSVTEGQWNWARWSERDTYLLRFVSACVVAAMVPIIYVAMNASELSYASQYSAGTAKWRLFLQRLEVVLIPSAPRLERLGRIASDPTWIALQALPNLLWIGMLVTGILSEKRRRIVWPLVIGMAWMVSGVLAYLPWPSSGMYYMMPFALGTMFVAACALHAPLSAGNRNRRAALAVAALLVVVASVEARSTLYQHRLRATLNGSVLATLGESGGADVLIGAIPSPLKGSGGWASHLQGFGSASNGMRVNSFADMSCADAKRALVSTPGIVVVSAAGGCGRLTEESLVVSGSVPRRQWPAIWKPMRSEGRMYVAYGSPIRRVSDSSVQ